MTFMKNDCMSFIQLIYSCYLNILENGVEKELKVIDSDVPTI